MAQVSGQLYYHLSRARQARRIRDIVLVRLEQIAPFPHDLVSKVAVPAFKQRSVVLQRRYTDVQNYFLSLHGQGACGFIAWSEAPSG